MGTLPFKSTSHPAPTPEAHLYELPPWAHLPTGNGAHVATGKTGWNQRWEESEVGIFILWALSLMGCCRLASSLRSPPLLLRDFSPRVPVLLTVFASQPCRCSQLPHLSSQPSAPSVQASPPLSRAPRLRSLQTLSTDSPSVSCWYSAGFKG